MKKTKTRTRIKNSSGKTHKKGGMATMMIGATGAVVGAALGTAAAIALANEKTRTMLTQKVGQLTDEAADAVDTADINYSNIRKQIRAKK